MDHPFFRPDISPVGTDRASVMRCRRSLLVARWWLLLLSRLLSRLCPAAAGICLVTARAVQGMAPYPGQARCLALGFWPECFRRLNVNGGQRPFPEETRSALDIEGKHVTVQGPSPDLTSSVSGLLRHLAYMRQPRSRHLRCCPRVAVVSLSRPPHRARGGHGPLRPELAALLGVWLSSQLARCAGGRVCWRLSGGVAVLPCCTPSATRSALAARGMVVRIGSAWTNMHDWSCLYDAVRR